MGETALDKETFDEYLNEMRDHYTADKVREHSVSDIAPVLILTLTSSITF